MSSSKTSGNLRDFRIDSRPAAPKTPAQNIKPRSSSVTEWAQESKDGFESESLWKTWEEDLNTQVAKPRSAPQAQLSEPVRPTQQNEVLVEEIQSRGPMPWAAELAHTERRMERLGEVEYSTSFKKQEMLKTQTAEFMAVLRHEFARQIETFNEARQSGAQAVHLYRITNTEQDFMLFRNSVKLVISGQRSGRILFAFNQFLGQIYTSTQNPNFELEAQWNAFDQLVWTYRNDRVQLQDIIRFFLSEFVRQSYK